MRGDCSFFDIGAIVDQHGSNFLWKDILVSRLLKKTKIADEAVQIKSKTEWLQHVIETAINNENPMWLLWKKKDNIQEEIISVKTRNIYRSLY